MSVLRIHFVSDCVAEPIAMKATYFILLVLLLVMPAIAAKKSRLAQLTRLTKAEEKIIECAKTIQSVYPYGCTNIADLHSNGVFIDEILKARQREGGYMIYGKNYSVDADSKERCNFTIILSDNNIAIVKFLRSLDKTHRELAEMFYIFVHGMKNLQNPTTLIATPERERGVVIDASGTAWGRTPPTYQPEKKRRSFKVTCSKVERIKYVYEYDLKRCRKCTIYYNCHTEPYCNSRGHGVESLILKEFSRRNNFLIKLKPSNDGIDDVVGGRFLIMATTRTYTYPFEIDRDVLIVPAAEKKLNKYALVGVFNKDLWIATLAAFFVIILTFHAVARFSKKLKEYGNIEFILLQSYAVLLAQTIGTPADRISKNVFIAWTMFSFVILNAYNAVFFSFLVSPTYEKQIDSFPSPEFFAQINTMVILRNKSMFEQLLNFPLESLPKSFNVSTNYDVSYDDLKSIVVEKDTSFYTTNYRANNVITLFQNYGLDTIYKIHFGINLIGLKFKKGRLTPHITNFIFRLTDNGLIRKWFKDYAKQRRFTNNSEPSAPKQLKIEHFVLFVYVYFACVAVAIVVFVYEIFDYKCKLISEKPATD